MMTSSPVTPYPVIPHAMPPDVLRHHADMLADIFSSAGTETAIAYLLSPLEQYFGITKFTFFWYDRVLQAGISDVGELNSVRTDPQNVFLFSRPFESPMIREGIGGLAPVIRNSVDFRLGLADSEPWRDFLRYHSFLRLALLEKNDLVYYALFYADEEHMFPPGAVRQLQELLRPLTRRLLDGQKIDQMLYQRWIAARADDTNSIINACAGLADAIIRARKVAATDLAVLVQGETGCGKEIFTNLLHSLSPRSGGPFIKINCGALPETLADSLLFGHEKGAFTGAIGRSAGYFEQAGKGTLFLDEVGELSPDLQVKLLRVLDRKTIRRLGGDTDIPVDFRLIAATNRDLKDMARKGTFRRDLWYRLAHYPLHIPPLRDHREDILPLAHHFISQHADLLPPGHHAAITEREGSRLVHYSWPGNIRELEFVVCRALVESQDSSHRHTLHFSLKDGDLFPPDPSEKAEKNRPTAEAPPTVLPRPDQPWPDLATISDRYIRQVVEHCEGRISEAAHILGIHPQTLYRKWRSLRKG